MIILPNYRTRQASAGYLIAMDELTSAHGDVDGVQSQEPVVLRPTKIEDQDRIETTHHQGTTTERERGMPTDT
jgi:hypothetical protein